MQTVKQSAGYYLCSYGITIEKRDNRWLVQGQLCSGIYNWFDTFRESKAYVSQLVNSVREDTK